MRSAVRLSLIPLQASLSLSSSSSMLEAAECPCEKSSRGESSVGNLDGPAPGLDSSACFVVSFLRRIRSSSHLVRPSGLYGIHVYVVGGSKVKCQQGQWLGSTLPSTLPTKRVEQSDVSAFSTSTYLFIPPSLQIIALRSAKADHSACRSCSKIFRNSSRCARLFSHDGRELTLGQHW